MAKLKKDGTPKRSGGAREGAGRKRSYDRYLTEFSVRKKKLAANGVDVSNVKAMTEKQFNTEYTAFTNQKKKEGKKPGNITRELVKKSVDNKVFNLSAKQVAAIKKKPQNVNYYELRTGAWLQKEISESKRQLRETGRSEEEIKSLISTEFFGS